MFTAILKKGRRLEWVVHYRDERNYFLYQLGKNFFHRIEVRNGERSTPVKLRHSLHHNEFVTVRIEVSSDSIVQRAEQNGRSVILDEWKHSGAEFARGRFGFHVPARDQIALREISFIPKIGVTQDTLPNPGYGRADRYERIRATKQLSGLGAPRIIPSALAARGKSRRR